MDNKPNFSREVKLQWAGCRETISLSGQSGAFFLTFLFIELIDFGGNQDSGCKLLKNRLSAAWHQQKSSKIVL
jgi:hypothetical protein